MTRLFRSLLFVSIIIFLPLAVFPVAAQIKAVDNCTDLGLDCGGTTNDLKTYIKKIVNGFLSLAGVVAAVVIVYAGIRYITSAGDDKKVEAAKHTILYAVIGLIVIGLSAVIVNFTLKAI